MPWTDERMDDFAKHSDQRFDRTDADIRFLREEMKAGFAKVDRRFEQIDRRFGEVDQRFREVNGSIEGLHETIHRTMLQLGAGLIATMAIGFAGIVVTQL